MKKYEYMTVDLSAEPSFNVHIKNKSREYSLQSIPFAFMGCITYNFCSPEPCKE